MSWIRHAFAVEGEGAAEPTEAQRLVVERLCRIVVERGMTTPAMMVLEMGRPMNGVASAAMRFFEPIVTALADPGAYNELAEFLERRGAIDYFHRRLEAMDAERDAKRREEMKRTSGAERNETS